MNLVMTTGKHLHVCVYEAARAVMMALGGMQMKCVKIAPEGTTLSGGRLGCCYKDDSFIKICIEMFLTRGKKGNIQPKLDFFMTHIQKIQGRRGGKERIREIYRLIRAHICISCAGSMATAIITDSPIRSPHHWLAQEDSKMVIALCGLLPSGYQELKYLDRQTERLLRTPDIWERVTNLAQSLHQAGEMNADELGPFLPAPIPNWPKAPRW